MCVTISPHPSPLQGEDSSAKFHEENFVQEIKGI